MPCPDLIVVLYMIKLKNCETIHQEGQALPLQNSYKGVPTNAGIVIKAHMKMLEKVAI